MDLKKHINFKKFFEFWTFLYNTNLNISYEDMNIKYNFDRIFN